MATMHWYGEEIKVRIDRHLATRIEYAGRAFRDYIRKQLAQRRSPPASDPGEYPHMGTGHLRRNVQMEIDRSEPRARVGTNVLYGKYLEFGTRGGYTIVPRRGRALRFVVAGKPVFRGRVTHPGIRPRPWFSRAAREFASEVKRIFEHRMEDE